MCVSSSAGRGPAQRGSPCWVPTARLPWAVDGKSILYRRNESGVENIWSVPLAGGAPDQRIFGFDVSPENLLVISRGNWVSDVVFLKNVKEVRRSGEARYQSTQREESCWSSFGQGVIGGSNGSIDAYANDLTQLILDISSYFAHEDVRSLYAIHKSGSGSSSAMPYSMQSIADCGQR